MKRSKLCKGNCKKVERRKEAPRGGKEPRERRSQRGQDARTHGYEEARGKEREGFPAQRMSMGKPEHREMDPRARLCG